MRIIDTQFGRRNQSLEAAIIATRNDNKRFRVRIRRNAYDDQSFAVTEAWTPNGWTEVSTVMDLKTLNIHSFPCVVREDGPWQRAARQDAENLLATAMQVVP